MSDQRFALDELPTGNDPTVWLGWTTLAQSKASHPGQSAWVSANAGSGKTHVLTQRVIRCPPRVHPLPDLYQGCGVRNVEPRLRAAGGMGDTG
jgi:fermentation-respiration switch protein FrsA (DUF1100 family)